MNKGGGVARPHFYNQRKKIMAKTVAIYNKGAAFTVLEVLKEKSVDKGGNVIKAKYGEKIHVPTGAVSLPELTAKEVMRMYPERCTLTTVVVSESDKKAQERVEALEKALESVLAVARPSDERDEAEKVLGKQVKYVESKKEDDKE